MSTYINRTATISEFVEQGLTVNGKRVNQVELSVLAKLGFMPKVGEHKPKRGRTAGVFEVNTEKNPMFGFVESSAGASE